METSAPAASTPSAPLTEAGSSPVKTDPGTEQSPGTPGADPKASKPAKAEPPKHWELKINGKTQKLTEEEMILRASQSEASQQRFKEAAEMRKQAESLIGRMRDPKNVMTALMDPALGLTKEQIRETFENWYAEEFIENDKLTPEQKRNRELEAKLKKYEDDDKGREAEKIRLQQESLTSQAREQVQTQIIEILETSGLPRTNFTIRRIAYWMQRNQANGIDAPMAVVATQVRNEIKDNLRDLVEASDGDVLIKVLGDNVIQKLRKYDLEQLRKLRTQGSQPVSETAPSSPSGERLTSSDVNARIRQMQRTGKY